MASTDGTPKPADDPDLIVTIDDRRLEADWAPDAPQTRTAIADALPLAGEATRWGAELYVSVPVDAPPENARTDVEEGALAFWPAGNACCLFWGPTPASESEEPRAASPVSVFAHVRDVSPLADLDPGAGARLTLERLE